MKAIKKTYTYKTDNKSTFIGYELYLNESEYFTGSLSFIKHSSGDISEIRLNKLTCFPKIENYESEAVFVNVEEINFEDFFEIYSSNFNS